MLHLPILRQGRAYRSVEVRRVADHRTGEAVAEVSQANAGLVARDLRPEAQAAVADALAGVPARDLLAGAVRAAEIFATATLPAGESPQTLDDYVRQTSSTTGIPHALVRRSAERVRKVLAELPRVVHGLTRGLDLEVLDRGAGEEHGHALSYVRQAAVLGVVLPSNSPGVHGLWTPALAFKAGLALKPGATEPWTPYRLLQAFLAAGLPPAALGYYPTDHAGAGEILQRCGRSVLFGDAGTTGAWHRDRRVELHGPGYSKVVLGPDASEDWARHLDIMVSSILDNGGRSCINASGVWVTANGRAVAEALAERLAAVRPRAAEDPAAQLSPFPSPEVARRISAAIDDGLRAGGARDVTASYRSGERLVRTEGGTYLLPTIVHCQSPDHPLAQREYLFPFAAVVEVDPGSLVEAMGSTLAASVVTADEGLRRRLLASPHIRRLTWGAVPTTEVSWDQPHEGNLFEHLYARRAYQGAIPA
jgi:acyl-CoA reductase-like NAD-dependent aldehyde dehydrogenase